MADFILIIAQWAIDPARPCTPADLEIIELLERCNTLHKGTVSILGPVALPEFQSLLGGDALPAFPTLVKRLAEASGLTNKLPSYNTINAAVRMFSNNPTTPLTPSQSTIVRILLEPLEHPGAIEKLHACIIEVAPASAFGFAHIVSAWLHSARFEHPDSYLLSVQRQLVVDDGCLIRGVPLECTVHAHRLLQADDPWLSKVRDPILRRMLRQLDATLYLFAAQHTEWGKMLTKNGFDERLFDPIYRAPYSPKEMTNRFFEVLRGYAGLSTWSALSIDGKPRVVGENNTSHEQLTKWRSGVRHMKPDSLRRLITHSSGFDPARHEDDFLVFNEGYRMTLSAIGAAARIDDAVADLGPDPRSILFSRCTTYMDHHRADLDTWVSKPAFT